MTIWRLFLLSKLATALDLSAPQIIGTLEAAPAHVLTIEFVRARDSAEPRLRSILERQVLSERRSVMTVISIMNF